MRFRPSLTTPDRSPGEKAARQAEDTEMSSPASMHDTQRGAKDIFVAEVIAPTSERAVLVGGEPGYAA